MGYSFSHQPENIPLTSRCGWVCRWKIMLWQLTETFRCAAAAPREPKASARVQCRKKEGVGGLAGSHLDQPCQEENEGYEVEVGAPARETVDGSVHEEHPTLLRCRLIHGEDAGTWNEDRRASQRDVQSDEKHRLAESAFCLVSCAPIITASFKRSLWKKMTTPRVFVRWKYALTACEKHSTPVSSLLCNDKTLDPNSSGRRLINLMRSSATHIFVAVSNKSGQI